MKRGSCLCGDITYEITGELRGKINACHCGQCRKQSGHYWASANVQEGDITVNGPVAWYEASDIAKRGFCGRCGSFLFWKAHDEDQISFALGALDEDEGARLEQHIFTADKGDYYDIKDGLPQQETN